MPLGDGPFNGWVNVAECNAIKKGEKKTLHRESAATVLVAPSCERVAFFFLVKEYREGKKRKKGKRLDGPIVVRVITHFLSTPVCVWRFCLIMPGLWVRRGKRVYQVQAVKLAKASRAGINEQSLLQKAIIWLSEEERNARDWIVCELAQGLVHCWLAFIFLVGWKGLYIYLYISFTALFFFSSHDPNLCAAEQRSVRADILWQMCCRAELNSNFAKGLRGRRRTRD